MAEFGTFRTSLSGFNKKDVLDYIDELQKTHAEELAVLQEERDRLFQENQELAARESESAGKVSQAEENADRLTARVEDLQRENARIQKSLDGSLQFTGALKRQVADLEEIRREKESLQQRLAACEEAAQRTTSLEEEKTRLMDENSRLARELERLRRETVPAADADRRIRELEAENRRYDELVGDVGSLVMEVRSMGQRFLDTACRRGEIGIEALEEGLASMEGMLQQARDRVEETRSQLREQEEAAGLRLEELVQSLEQAVGQAEAPLGPEQPSGDSSFFR